MCGSMEEVPLPGFFSMFPHHQNEEREGGKGGGRGKRLGSAREERQDDKIEKPRSKEDPFRSTIFECDDFD